jgi:hypothetical protein
MLLSSQMAVVPARFIVSISHLIVVILCLMGTVKLSLSTHVLHSICMLIILQHGNVYSGLALTHSDADFTSAKDSLITALIVTLICIGIGEHPPLLL